MGTEKYALLASWTETGNDIAAVELCAVISCDNSFLTAYCHTEMPELSLYPIATEVVRLGVHESRSEVALGGTIHVCTVGRELRPNGNSLSYCLF